MNDEGGERHVTLFSSAKACMSQREEYNVAIVRVDTMRLLYLS